MTRRLDIETAEAEADRLAAAYEKAADRIESALSRAARSGERSISAMVESILADLARLAAEELIERPINRALDRFSRRFRR